MSTDQKYIVGERDLILVTGSNGFVGSKVVRTLLDRGYRNLRCFTRPTSDMGSLEDLIADAKDAQIDIVKGNLLSMEDCRKATEEVKLIYHLAAGIEKTFPGSFLNSVVTTRNLLESASENAALRRFVNVSSFAVYDNTGIRRGGLLDERCPVDRDPIRRHEAYAYAKIKQDEIVQDLGSSLNIPFVIVRPGAVIGPGKAQITARVGIDTFGFFLHLGGGNRIPFTYVDNCAEAIVLAGLVEGVEGEVFNIVDDDLPTSRRFLREFKKYNGRFFSLPVPYFLFYAFSWSWEKYARWSEWQLPPVFNPPRCAVYWKGNRYSNRKLKDLLGWEPEIPMDEALSRMLTDLNVG